MKRNETPRYTRRFTIRFTVEEFDQVNAKFKKTTCQKLSDYLRTMALSNPVKVIYRNQSADDFLESMVSLKNELNAIGSNFNQTIKQLHSMSHLPEIKTWLLLNESSKAAFMSKVEEIKIRMNQVYELWSQK